VRTFSLREKNTRTRRCRASPRPRLISPASSDRLTRRRRRRRRVQATATQLLITYCIRTYGALLFATVQTTRQFLSILLSCLLFAHTLTVGQAVGTSLVFLALFYRYARASPRAYNPRVRSPPNAMGSLFLYGHGQLVLRNYIPPCLGCVNVREGFSGRPKESL
jgi:hypothetical protein